MLVSACLLGRSCRYDGGHCRDDLLERELRARGLEALPICPELEGGLGTPRPAASFERRAPQGDGRGEFRLRSETGEDLTAAFERGARAALELCRREGVREAYLKENSPSCGVHRTSVEGVRVAGMGLTSARLQAAGVRLHAVEGSRSEESPAGP